MAAAMTRGSANAPRASSFNLVNSGRATLPAMVSSEQPACFNSLMAFPISPSDAQPCGNVDTSSGLAMPSRARTNTLRPSRCAASATAKGSVPPPAMIPSVLPCTVMVSIAVRWASAGVASGHADRPFRIGENEGNDFRDFRRVFPALARLARALGQRTAAEKDETERRAQIMDARAGHAHALEPDEIEPRQFGVVAPRNAVGNDVVGHTRDATDKRVTADAPVLLYGGQPSDIHAVSDRHVTAEGDPVGEGHIVADMAIMRDMAGGHEVTVCAYLRETAAFQRSSIHGDVLADHAT